MSKARLESFSDAVFAIICTLLVVSLQVPDLHRERGETLIGHLVGMAPGFLSYVLSFALVTLYWIAHHEVLTIVRNVSAGLIWMNNFFLMWLALLPFPTEVMGRYPHEEMAVLFFGLITLLAAVSFVGVRLMLLYKPNLRDPQFDTHSLKISIRNSTIGIALYVVALLISYLSDEVTMTMYGLIPFLFLIPVRVKIVHAAHA
ncbi:MAG: TMEM175 family protein [Rhizomicrobium sp.]|jgi:uncharacterized membrane protein